MCSGSGTTDPAPHMGPRDARRRCNSGGARPGSTSSVVGLRMGGEVIKSARRVTKHRSAVRGQRRWGGRDLCMWRFLARSYAVADRVPGRWDARYQSPCHREQAMPVAMDTAEVRPGLSPRHRKQLIHDSGIPAKIVEREGLWSASAEQMNQLL